MKSPRKRKWIYLTVLLFLLSACATEQKTVQAPQPAAPVSAPATVSVLQSLTFTDEGETTRIRLEGSSAFPAPLHQVMENPLRLVVDLPGTDLRTVKEPLKIENGTIGEVWVTQYDDKGRIEIHLLQNVPFTITREERVLTVSIEKTVEKAEGKTEKKEAEPAPTPVQAKVDETPGPEAKKEPEAPVTLPAPAAPPVEEKKEIEAKAITDLTFERKNEAIQVHILADGKVARYDSFQLDGPPRVVIDFRNLDYLSERKRVKLEENPYVKGIRIGQYPDKVRLVFDSAKPQLPPYQIQPVDHRVVVSFGKDLPPAGSPGTSVEKDPLTPVASAARESVRNPSKDQEKTASAPVSSPAPGKPVQLIGVDFKQLEDRSRVLVTASEAPSFESALIAKRVLALDLKNTTAPKHLRRDLDTSEFQSPIQSVQLQNIKRGRVNDVRVLIKLREDVPYETNLEGKQVLVDVLHPKRPEAQEKKGPSAAPDVKEAKAPEPPAEGLKKEERKKEEGPAPAETGSPKGPPEKVTQPVPAPPAGSREEKKPPEAVPAQEKIFSGRKISLDFKDADIRNILRLIAEVSNLNIISGEDVSGKVTMRLVDVPWDQALDVILSAKNLGMSRVGNVVRIAPMETLKRELQSELESRRGKEKLEDLTTELVSVNYATAKEIVNQVKTVLSERGDIKVDDRTNTLIVKDIPKNILNARSLVRQLDTKTPQVMIEARIVEASLLFQRELGISWGFDKTFGKQAEIKGGLAGNKFVDLPAVTKSGAGLPGTFEFLINSAKGMVELDMAISAHEANGDIKIISSPKIATLDNKEASVEQGLRIPYLKITTEGTVTTDFIEANLKLTVTPHVTNDGHIKMSIKAKKDAPNNTIIVQGVPSIDKKEAITEVLIKDNGVVVIGGIYTIEKNNSTEGLPLLKQIPLLGWLFKREAKEDQRKDLLIFISPKIIKDAV